MEALAAKAEETPLAQHGELGRGRDNRVDNINSNEAGTSATYLSRRIAINWCKLCTSIAHGRAGISETYTPRPPNVTEAEILHCVQVLDRRKQSGERTDLASAEARLPMEDVLAPESPTKGKSAEQTAAIRAALGGD